jgi:uncharacterized protein (DUF1330 family)
MNAKYKMTLAVLVGAALGAAAVQGLHAQAKPKAYSIGETVILDKAARAAFVAAVDPAQQAAGGHPLNTGGGKIVALDGAAPPESVAVTEWDSLAQAQAFYASAAWTSLAPQREKAIKTVRRYLVEATK